MLMVKNPPTNAGDIRDIGSIPGSGRSPGGGHGNPLQCSCLENPMVRGSWRATVHGVAKSWTRLKQLSKHPWLWAKLQPLFLHGTISCIHIQCDRHALSLGMSHWMSLLTTNEKYNPTSQPDQLPSITCFILFFLFIY